MHEAYATSRGTKCKQFLFSLSLNPPQTENVPASAFEDALDKVEKKLGLENQPRVVVFHEKEGRHHAHCVWSRIDTENMKAVHLPHYKLKLNDVSKQIYLQHGWKLPEGYINKNNPLNFTLAEWQQAKRHGLDAKALKRNLQECWNVSDDKKSFQQALSEKGYMLAKGDHRGYVAVGWQGDVVSLSRALDVKTRDIKTRLGPPSDLPSVEESNAKISKDLRPLYESYNKELDHKHKKQIAPLNIQKDKLIKVQRAERAVLASRQHARHTEETNQRASRVRKGLPGFWD